MLGRETAIQEALLGRRRLALRQERPGTLALYVRCARNARRQHLLVALALYVRLTACTKTSSGSGHPRPKRIFATPAPASAPFGRESIGSWFEQALVARRQTHFSYDAETVIDFSPRTSVSSPALTAYYSRYNFFYLTVTAHSDGQRELLIMSSEKSWPDGNLKFPARRARFPYRQGQAGAPDPRRRAADSSMRSG